MHRIRNAFEENGRIGCEASALIEHQSNGNESGKAQRTSRAGKTLAFVHTDAAVEKHAAGRYFIDDLGAAGRQPQHLPILYHHGLWHLQRFGEPRVLGQVAQLAMHRHGNLRPHPTVHFRQFVARGMAGDVHEVVFHREHLHAQCGQLVVQRVNADLVSRNDPRREDDGVTWAETDVTGGKKLSIKSMTVTADGQTVTIERDAANGSLTVTLPDQPAVTLDEDTIDTYLADAMGSADLDQQALDIIKREFKQVIGLGLVTVQVDGKWYVSPIRSVSDIFVSLLKGLEPGDVDYLINLAKN